MKALTVKQPYLAMSGELGDGHTTHMLPIEDDGIEALARAIRDWREEFADSEGGEEFTVEVRWMTKREFEELPDL